MKNINKFNSVALVGFMMASGVMTVQADDLMPNPAMLDLGRAASFALLGSTAITTATVDFSGTGAKGVGIVDLSPWTRNGVITGQSPSDIHIGNATTVTYNLTAGDAWFDANATYTSAKAAVTAGLSGNGTSGDGTKIIDGELGGKTFTRGMYTIGATPYQARNAGAITMTTNFTLDGGGDANSVFIFQTDAAASTAANIGMSLINGARADHIFWLVGAAFSTGAGTSFAGTVLAGTAATIGDNTEFKGQLFALNGAITVGTGFIVPTVAAIPEPGTFGAAMGAVGLGVVMMRRRKPRGSC